MSLFHGIFAAVVFFSTEVAFAGTAPDPLWQKALAIAESNANWVAGLVVTRSEVLYKGETNGVHEIWQRTSLGADGEVMTRTVKIMEDGKDVTAEEKKKEKKEKKEQDKSKKGASQGSCNPFDAEVQPRR